MKKLSCNGYAVILSVLAYCLLVPPCLGTSDSENEPLQGRIEESGIAPTRAEPLKPVEPIVAPVVNKHKKTRLTGEAKESGLEGNVTNAVKDKPYEEDGNALKGQATESDTVFESQNAKTDRSPNLLKGRALIEENPITGEDPDIEDQELMIEWDRWRNRFLSAVQSRVQETLNNPDETMLRWDPARETVIARFPLGTVAWFSCQITNERRIVNLKLLRSSGFPNYDRAVLDAVSDLNASAILRYPRRSRRTIVNQIAGIKTAETSETPNFRFGDIERYRVPVP